MPKPAIVRAAYLNAYLSAMRQVGIPVEGRLDRSKLPAWIESTMDEYVSLPLSLDFLASCGRDLPLTELAFLATRHSSFASLSPMVQRAIVVAPTGLVRMEALARAVHRENSTVSLRMVRQGGDVRVVCDLSRLASHPFLCLVEWVTLEMLVSIVRSIAGPGWYPSEMTFLSRQAPPEAAREALGNTRILVGQPSSSILLDAHVLACSVSDASMDAVVGQLPDGIAEAWNLATALRSIVRPYLREGKLDLDNTAEIVGMSTRTLQRRLRAMECSFSTIIQQARFEIARELLGNPSVSITNIAFAAGYENPQHFSRAFRRLTGVSPRSFRQRIVIEPLSV